MLKLVFITLTLIQGHSGSAKAKYKCWIILTTKQATRIKLAISTTVGHFLRDLDFENIYGLTILLNVCIALHYIANAIECTACLTIKCQQYWRRWWFILKLFVAGKRIQETICLVLSIGLMIFNFLQLCWHLNPANLHIIIICAGRNDIDYWVRHVWKGEVGCNVTVRVIREEGDVWKFKQAYL